MAALLSSRPALVARSTTTMSTGAIVGATIGSVMGAVIIFLCALPFILRARRRIAFRRQHGDDAVEEAFPGAPDFLSRSHQQFGDAFRRLSHSTPAHPPQKAYEPGVEQDRPYQNGDSIEKPPKTLQPAGVAFHGGLPSPISPPFPAAAGFEPLPGKSLQNGRTATGSLTLATQTTHESISTQMLSRDATMTEAGNTTLAKESFSDSFASPRRQGTFGSRGFSEEPESFASAGDLHRVQSRRKSSHISDSVRHLAHIASSALRRGSSKSTGSIKETPRSPSPRPADLPHQASAPAVIEQIDTEAPGEAYSYYHDDAVAPASMLGSPATFGQTSSIPRIVAESLPTLGSVTSPTSVSTITPISPPVSPARLPTVQRTTFGQMDSVEDDEEQAVPSLPGKRGLIKPIKRMDTSPLQPIMSDIPSPPLPDKPEKSVNPRDIMNPTTNTEKDWEVRQELHRLSTSPPTRELTAPPLDDTPPSQPTPAATPSPEPRMEIEMEQESAYEPIIKQEQFEPQWPMPQLALNGGDVNMMDDTAPKLWSTHTPPPSTGPSAHTTPFQTPDSRVLPYMGTPSPARSNDGSSDIQEGSPRAFKCAVCNREFDQFHKLNHHTRYHDRPHACEKCGKSFGTKTHLERHINDKHEQRKKYFCTVHTCQYSKQGGKSFPRKDNWRRHMQNKHKIVNPAEPEEVVMGGTEEEMVQFGR